MYIHIYGHVYVIHVDVSLHVPLRVETGVVRGDIKSGVDI